MSIPLFPSLQPNVLNPFWSELDPPIDEEAAVLELEQEHREWKASIGQVFSNVVPIGKTTHDADEDDLDDMGDDEDDTTTSDDDDMDDDDDPPGLYRVHNNPIPSAPPVPIASIVTTGSSDSSSSSESSVTVTLNRVESLAAMELESSVRAATRPARMIVGRHIPAPRPGMPQQAVRAAFIDTAGRPVYSGRTSTGTVSPTSRAFIEAALHSPTGPVRLDIPDDDDDTDDDVPDRSAPPQRAPRLFPGPVSDQFSRYSQIAAVGQIHPSVSSTQIDNLFETMHQAQRAHAARAAAPERERITALSEASSSNVGPSVSSNTETDSDSSLPPFDP